MYQTQDIQDELLFSLYYVFCISVPDTSSQTTAIKIFLRMIICLCLCRTTSVRNCGIMDNTYGEINMNIQFGFVTFQVMLTLIKYCNSKLLFNAPKIQQKYNETAIAQISSRNRNKCGKGNSNWSRSLQKTRPFWVKFKFNDKVLLTRLIIEIFAIRIYSLLPFI